MVHYLRTLSKTNIKIYVKSFLVKSRKKKNIIKGLKMLVKNVIGMSWKQELLKNNIGYLLMKNGKAADSKE